MFRSINAPTGLVRTLTALSLVATIALVGCGTDMATAPEFVSIESDDGGYQPGELPLPGHKGLIESPKGLAIEEISAKGAIITWNAATTGLTALIDLNGVRIAEVDASTGRFTDNLAKRPGMFHYAVCFQNSEGRTGGMKAVDGQLKATPDGDDRRDDRSEDGR